MRLVEVVMLMGAHCVSPVEHTQMMTDAAKGQCAVVIEKDTDTGTMIVTPGGAASDPQVIAAIERFRVAPADPLTGGGTTGFGVATAVSSVGGTMGSGTVLPSRPAA